MVHAIRIRSGCIEGGKSGHHAGSVITWGSTLAEKSLGNLHQHYIVQLLDHFSHTGPNGTHDCLVFELLGPTVDAITQQIYEVGDVLDPEIILRVSEQLLRGIKFMHDAGYAHGGTLCRCFK